MMAIGRMTNMNAGVDIEITARVAITYCKKNKAGFRRWQKNESKY
jgi:hypothetical protein